MGHRHRVRLIRGSVPLRSPLRLPDTVRRVLQDVRLVAATDKAILVAVAGAEVWFPRSRILRTDLARPGDVGFLLVPEWLVRSRRLR